MFIILTRKVPRVVAVGARVGAAQPLVLELEEGLAGELGRGAADDVVDLGPEPRLDDGVELLVHELGQVEGEAVAGEGVRLQVDGGHLDAAAPRAQRPREPQRLRLEVQPRDLVLALGRDSIHI